MKTVAAVVIGGLVLAAGAIASTRSHVLAFNSLPHSTGYGLPRDVRADARVVATFGDHVLTVSPTRNGNFCDVLTHVLAGCRVRPAAGNRAPVLGVTVVGDSTLGVSALSGSVIASPDDSLYLVSRNGHIKRVPLVYVSAPIDAGFYWVPIPKGDRVGSSRPVQLVLKNGRSVIDAKTLPAFGVHSH